MTSNILPSGIQHLIGLAGRIAHGLEVHGPWLKKLMPTEEFRSSLTTLQKSERAFGSARAAKALAGNEAVAADEALTVWLAKARLVMMLAHGAKWSERWVTTGFTHRGTDVPKRLESRIAVARTLVEFLTEHPEFAVPFAEVTAEGARAIYERMVEARSKAGATKADCVAKKRIRDSAERLLRRNMREVIVFLGILIAANDPRWLSFGLNRPRRSLGDRRAARSDSKESTVETILLPAQEASPTVKAIAA
jgi:hypothetical protein